MGNDGEGDGEEEEDGWSVGVLEEGFHDP